MTSGKKEKETRNAARPVAEDAKWTSPLKPIEARAVGSTGRAAWSQLYPTKIPAYEARLGAGILVALKLELLGNLRYVVTTL